MSVLKSKIGRGYVFGSALLSAVSGLLVIIVLFINSVDVFTADDIGLFSTNWNPSDNKFGVLSMLYGTIVVTLIALTIAVPLGILTAIFTSEVLSPKLRLLVKSILELLAGIPSVIYGLIGIVFLSVWVQNVFDLQSGRTFLTAGILLATMVLPTIVTLVDDALQSVPQKYRESAKGLGLYQFEVVKESLLPIVKTDIIGAVLLAFGRALGETMAVMLVIGSIDRIPTPFFNLLAPGQTITSKLGRELAETSFGSLHFSAMIFMGLLLLIIVLVITIIAQLKFKHNRLYE